MPYSIKTKDGIKINNIPDDVAPDSDILKQRVSVLRAGKGQPSAEAPVEQAPAPVEEPTLLSRVLGVKPSAYETTAEDVAKMREERGIPGFSAIKDIVTGESKRTEETERLPEFKGGMVFGELDPRSSQITARMLAMEDSDELAGSLMDFGIRNRKDRMGNTIVEWNDPESGSLREAVLNQPGLSGKDIATGAAQMVPEIIAGKLAGSKTAGKGKLARYAAQAGAQFITSGLREGVQQRLGGEYDLIDVAVDTVLAGGSEAVGDLASYGVKRITKEGKKLLEKSKTVKGLINAGMDKAGVKKLARRLSLDKQLSSEFGLEPIVPASSAALGRRSYAQPLDQILVAAKENRKLAEAVESRVDSAVKGGRGAIEDTLIRMGDVDQIKAIDSVSDTLSGLVNQKVVNRRLAARVAYKDTFKDVPDVAVGNVDKAVGRLVALADGDSKLQPRLKALKKSLKTPDYERQVSDFDKAMRADPLMPSTAKPPRQEISIQDMQGVDQELADLIGIAIKEKNTKVLTSLNTLKDQVNKQMNAVTGGKYGKTKELYKRLSGIMENIEGGDIGKGADAGKRTLAGFLEKVFNPSDLTQGYSREFLRELKKADPQAAKDLVASYIYTQVQKAQSLTRPSEIIDAIYGQNTLKTLVSVDPKTAGKMAKLKAYLGRFEGLENVSSKEAGAFVENNNLNKGVWHTLGEWFGTMGTALRKSGSEKSRKNNIQTVVDAFSNPMWSKDIDEILKMPELSEQVSEASNTLFEKVLAWNQRRSNKRQAAQELMGMTDQLIESQLQEGESE